MPFVRPETAQSTSFTLFGKLPNRADFVRVNVSHPAAIELDQLIQRAYERAHLDEIEVMVADRKAA